MTPHNASRRLFLRHASALSSLGAAAAPLALNLSALGSAAAQSASDYKALVCIFLYGGNDSLNMVLPTDGPSWDNYTKVRGQAAADSIALRSPGTAALASAAAASPARLGGVLPISPLRPQGRSFALHPLMGTLQSMFDTDKRLAIVPNVGPLIVPTSKAQYLARAVPLPRSLGSHNDQQNMWQSFRPEGSTKGWGGLMGDLLASQNGQAVFTSISIAGNSVWMSGDRVRQYQVGTNGTIRMGTNSVDQIYGSSAVAAAMKSIVSTSRGGHVLETDLAAIASRSIQAEETLRTVLKPASHPLFGTQPVAGSYDAGQDPKLQYDNPLTGTKAFNGLAQQMQVVARMVDGSSAPGVAAKRQVFFVSLGGFDTHDAQNRSQADLFARLAHAMRYLDTALAGMGALNKVTAFTASEFGRTFVSNGDGTDHAWGAHHFVMGGAVRGGDLYGAFPTLGAMNAGNNNFDSSPDQLGSGSLLPTTSVDQLGATLAKWFGISDADALTVFPNLAGFGSRDLGFMRAG